MITCPRCGFVNNYGGQPSPLEARFCQNCGANFVQDRLSTHENSVSGPVQPVSGEKQSYGRLVPLRPGSILYHPHDTQRCYGIITARELDRSVYYDAMLLSCTLCHHQHTAIPNDGQCQQCQTPLEVVLVHERRQSAEDRPANKTLSRLLQLSAGHGGILQHRDIIVYKERVFTVTYHPGRWRVLVRGRQQRSLDEALAGSIYVGQALTYLHQQGFAYAEVGGASIESLVVVGQGMNVKLADLSPARPLPTGDPEAVRSLINQDIAFLANLLFFLATGQSLLRSSINSAPLPLRQLVERAMREQYEDVQNMIADVERLPFETTRSLKPSHGQTTHPGQKYTVNEDAITTFTYDKNQEGQSVPIGFYLVADGMGGQDAGQVASDTVSQVVTDWIIHTRVLPDLRKITRQLMVRDVPGDLLTYAIQQANRALLEFAKAKQIKPGATVTAALIMGNLATVVNVGDSRTYLLRAGRLEQITVDHSLVARLVDSGVITPDEVRTHPKRNQIYRCLGSKPELEVDVFTVPLQRGDRLVLCSDGLWEMVLDAEIRQIVEQSRTPQSACDMLIEAANQVGGEDNISVIVVELE